MKKEFIKMFCGIQNKKDLYLENKTLVFLYSALALFFVIVVNLLDLYKTHEFLELAPSVLFVVSDFFFVFLLLKNKNNSSYENYFYFQGVVTVALSLIWISLIISTIRSKNLDFSWLYICGICLGVCFSVFFLLNRLCKWKSYKAESNIKPGKAFNSKFVSLTIVVLLSLSCFLKTIDEEILFEILVGLLFVLFFIFMTIAGNMFANCYIVKKYAYDMNE